MLLFFFSFQPVGVNHNEWQGWVGDRRLLDCCVLMSIFVEMVSVIPPRM